MSKDDVVFKRAVLESRVFYRRRVAERLMVTTGYGPAQAAQMANEVTQALAKFEDIDAEAASLPERKDA